MNIVKTSDFEKAFKVLSVVKLLTPICYTTLIALLAPWAYILS